MTESVVRQFGLRPVINSAGAMSDLGSSTTDTMVAQATAMACREWIDMDELATRAGLAVAAATGAEAGFVTSCAAAGVAIAAAACITRGDPSLVQVVPHLPAGVVTEVIIQKAHAVDFGAPIVSMLGLGGATVIEIGSANRCSASLMAASMRTPKAAVVYVVSHHVAGEDLVDLERAIALAHASNTPLILDAAAEVDLRRYVRLGADLVVYSGHKAIAGPTSGIVCGSSSLVGACRAQGTGVGRIAKIGKEGLVGLIVALEQYGRREDQSAVLEERVAVLAAQLTDEPGVRCERVLDPSRPIPRLRVFVVPEAGISARTLVDRLAAASPSIRCREHGVKSGFFEIDPRGLYNSQVALVSEGIRAALRPGSPSQAVPAFR